MALFNKKTKEQEEPEKKEAKPVVEEQAAVPASLSLPKGGDAYSYQVVLSPHITEKGTIAGEQNKYVFKVSNGVNKTEIKKAIQNLYKVEVAEVRTSYTKPKARQVGRSRGWKTGFKKAIVSLKEGSKIDLAA